MDAGKPQDQSLAIAFNVQRHAKKKAHGGMEPAFAHGGMADADEHYSSIADAILAKKRSGQADLAANSEEKPNLYDDLNADAAGEEQFDDGQISAQPEDSNEHGDEREKDSENKRNMISAIRAKFKGKRGA